MPQQVNLGAPWGIVDYPDEFTPEQIISDYEGRESNRLRLAHRARIQTVRQADINAAQQESRIPESIALGVDAGIGAAPIAAGHVIGALVPSQADIEAGGQRAPSGYPQDLSPGVGGFPVNLGFNAPTLRYLGKQLVNYGVGRQRAAREEAEQLTADVPSRIAGSLAETATVSSETLPFAALGMAPVSFAAGLQQYGLQKEQWKQQLQQQNPNLSDDEAYRIADGPAALSGVLTTGLTRVFGGTEKLVNRIVEGKLKVEGVKVLLREANLAGATEFPEEGLDQLAQGFIEKAYIDPNKPVGDIVNDAVMAGLTGYGLGIGHGIALQAPLHAASAVQSAVEPILEESRVRRQSRDESRDRISRIIAQRESEVNAISSGTSVEAPSQEEGVRQEADGSVRLRVASPTGLETQTGTEVANAPIAQTVETTTPVVPAPTATVPETPAASETPSTVVGPLTQPQSVVQEAIDAAFKNPEIASQMLAEPETPSATMLKMIRPFDSERYASRDASGDLILDLPKFEAGLRAGHIMATPAQTALLLHLLQTREEHPINPIRLIDSASGNVGYQGRFTTRFGSNIGNVEVVLRSKNGDVMSDRSIARILTHELLHNAVTSKIGQASPEIQTDAKSLYDFVVEKSAGTEWQAHNATKNINEFFSEAMSRKAFRDWLASLDYSMRTPMFDTGKRLVPTIKPTTIRKSAFGRFLEIVKKLLKLPDFIRDAYGREVDAITALDQVIDVADRLQYIRRSAQSYLESSPSPVEPTPIAGLQVAGAAAQVGRVADNIYRSRESGGLALEGLAYQRKQFKTAQAELKRLSDIAYGRFGASAQTEEPIVVPDPGEGVGITDGRIVVGDEFVNTLNAAGVPHSTANVQAMQGEIYFENAAKRLNNLQDQIETLMTARVYYQQLGVSASEIEKIDEKLTKLQEQEGVLSGAAHGTETVGGRSSEIRANETLRPERMAQRDALGLRPVSEFFGRQVGGYREFLNRASEAAHLAAALRDAATDPAEIARLTTEASRWLTLPQDVQNSIRSGLSLTDDQRAAAFASMAVVFDEFDLIRARMKEIADARLPEIDKEERALLLKIADHKIASGMAEVMVADVLATLDGDNGFTGTLQSQAVTQALRERLTAIQTFALAIGENIETNKALFEWLANPTTPPTIPVGASYGVDAQTLAMILDEVRRNPSFGSAIVTLVAASQKKLANLPVVQLEQIKALVDAGNMDAARTLANRIMGRANARASIAEASLRESLRTLDGLNIERLSLQHGVSMFNELADSEDFKGIRDAVANSPYGLVEPMVAQNNTATTLKPFGAKDIPSHPGFVMGAGADPVLKSDWFHKVDQWHVAAQHHLDAYDAAQALYSADPLANPQPSALGFDLPKVRGLRDATQRYVPGSFLELSLLSEAKRWKIPRLIREMSKTAWFRQHDFVTKMVTGITGNDLRVRLADFVNHFLIARAVIQQFDDIPKKLHAAMKSHPSVQMNISNYRERIWNEMAHWGRDFGSPVRIGWRLPKSGELVTSEDLALLKRQGQFEEQLRRRVTETNPTAGIRIQSGGRELVRSAAAVGDYGVPRHLNRGADIFISDVLTAYAPTGTPPAINAFDNTTDLSATSTHPVVAFWNKNIPLLVQHVLDVRRGDRAMQLNPTMQAAELATESDWRSTGTPAIHSVEELVSAIVSHAPPMPGWNVRDRIVAGLNEELRQYRDAADKIAKERAERAQARTSRAIIAFSADNEFTRPAAKLELPSELYDYGSLTAAEHLTVTSRANHERVVAYATAVQRAVSELQDRLNRYEKGKITEAEAASSYGGDLDEMKQVLGILRKIAADFEAAYRTGNPTLTQSQWYREGFGFLTSSVLALPTVGLRNMTQGQFETYIMSRAMGLSGSRLTMWRALLTAIKTVTRAAIDTGLHVLRGTDVGASFLTGKNVQLFTKLADQIATTILSPDYRAAGDRVHELGYDTREKFLERMKRIWEQTEETTTRDDAGALKISGRRVAGLAGVPIKVMRAALDRIGVQQYDQSINATVLPYATWMQKRMEEVALTYGAERARQGLTTFDATDPRWKLQPHEFGAFKSEQQNKDALGNFELFLELSANSEGFQLERNMWKFYQDHQAGGHQHLFTDRQFDAMQRRMLAEFNASTPANRSSAAAGNNVVRNLLTLQGYVSDGLLKLINLVAGGSRDRTYLAATLGKLPVLTALALMSLLIGFMQVGLTGEWEKRIRGRATTLATPFDRDFWSSWKRFGEGTLRATMAQLFYIGDIILMMRGEVQGNRGFDPVGRVWPLSIVQRWLATARGMWNTAKGSGGVKDTLGPLFDYGRQTLPYWLEAENLFGQAQGAIKQGERVIRGEAQLQGLLPDSRQSSAGPSYGPNTIVRRNLGEAVSSYWKAQQGGNSAGAESALVDARAQMKKLEDFYFKKYVAAGDSESVAMTKAQRDVWNDYQEINPVVAAMLGKRPTQAQYELIRKGMTGERATILDNAVQAWQAGAQALFGKAGSITREEVAGSRGGGGGGGGGSTRSIAVGLGGGSLRSGIGAGSLGGGSLTGTRVASSLSGTRRRGLGTRTRRRSSITGGTTRRRTGPRISRAGGTRRRSLGLKRRRTYSTA